MSDIRAEIHEEIDQLSDEELVGLQKFLATYPDIHDAICRRAPVDPLPLSDESIRKIEEAEEWLEHNEAIPHEEVMREFGLA